MAAIHMPGAYGRVETRKEGLWQTAPTPGTRRRLDAIDCSTSSSTNASFPAYSERPPKTYPSPRFGHAFEQDCYKRNWGTFRRVRGESAVPMRQCSRWTTRRTRHHQTVESSLWWPHPLAAISLHPPTAWKTAFSRATAIRSVPSYLRPRPTIAPPGLTSERQAWDSVMREHIAKRPTGTAPLKPRPSSAA